MMEIKYTRLNHTEVSLISVAEYMLSIGTSNLRGPIINPYTTTSPCLFHMTSHRKGVCIHAWRCLRYKENAAACNLEGGGPFCGDWRRFNGQIKEKPNQK